MGKWRQRYVAKGLAGIAHDAPRRGRPPVARQATTARIIEWTTQKKPRNATHWSCRTLARELGTSHAMVNRVWQANDLKPHLDRTFKVSNDRQFAAKVVDVVGLVSPPAGTCLGVVRGPEDANPGVGPHPAFAAIEEGTLRHDDP